jgi:hypothetical protein
MFCACTGSSKWKDSCSIVIRVLLKQELENLHTQREREREKEKEREREREKRDERKKRARERERRSLRVCCWVLQSNTDRVSSGTL